MTLHHISAPSATVFGCSGNEDRLEQGYQGKAGAQAAHEADEVLGNEPLKHWLYQHARHDLVTAFWTALDGQS